MGTSKPSPLTSPFPNRLRKFPPELNRPMEFVKTPRLKRIKALRIDPLVCIERLVAITPPTPPPKLPRWNFYPQLMVLVIGDWLKVLVEQLCDD